MSKEIGLLFVLILSLSACTSIKVQPLNKGLAIKNICIEKNDKVIVQDFLSVVRDGFQRHGISSIVFKEKKPKICDAVLTYTALQTWDFALYLSHAELEIYENDIKVAGATYHLNGKGGFDLSKWKGTKAKIDPVIDQLLQEYN